MSETRLVEYNKQNAEHFPADFRQNVDDYLIIETGADASILWQLGGRITILLTINGENVTLELHTFEIASGYNAELGLYVLGGKVYVEDDYDWNEIPDLMMDAYAQTVYSDSIDEAYYEDGETYTDEDDEDDESDDGYDEADNPPPVAEKSATPYGMNGAFPVNYFKESYRDVTISYEPLVVNNFNLDHPILKVEEAYRNALCEIESYPTCGYIVLFHGGHFYIPVESIEDPVNRDVFYFIKIFNSYPVAVTSGRISVLASAEIFNQTYNVGIRFRPGYCVNWRKLFIEHLLPDNYLDMIPDLYSVTDKPYGSPEYEDFDDYDGFKLREQDDDFDDSDDDSDDDSNDS